MKTWVAGVALVGLICVMSIPAPGLLGIAIGAFCVLAIAISAAMLLFERLVTRFVDPMLEGFRRQRDAKRRRRALHAGSGMARKV